MNDNREKQAEFEEIDFGHMRQYIGDDIHSEAFAIGPRRKTAAPEEQAKKIVEEQRESEEIISPSSFMMSVEEDGLHEGEEANNVTEENGAAEQQIAYEDMEEPAPVSKEEELADEILRIAQNSETEGFLGQVDALFRHTEKRSVKEAASSCVGVSEKSDVLCEGTSDDTLQAVSTTSSSSSDNSPEVAQSLQQSEREGTSLSVDDKTMNDGVLVAEILNAETEKTSKSKKEKKPKKEKKMKKEKPPKKTQEEILAEQEEKEAKFQRMLISSEEEASALFKKRKLRNMCLNAVTAISMVVFMICVLEIGWYYMKSFQYKKDMENIFNGIDGGIAGDTNELIQNMTQDNGDVLIFPDEVQYDVIGSIGKFDKEVSDSWGEKYQKLAAMNPDCIGVIEIPDTPISLPVMFTPEDSDKYLYRNFSGEKEYRGLPFLDGATKLGVSQNYIIHGHNMKDGTSFGTLDEYLKKSYYNKHKYIYFNTPFSEGVYEIMAVCKTKIYTANDDCFKYYKYGGELTKTQFNTYIREVKKMSEYNTGVSATWGDELITLSTCNRYTEEGRLIIVAKRIK